MARTRSNPARPRAGGAAGASGADRHRAAIRRRSRDAHRGIRYGLSTASSRISGLAAQGIAGWTGGGSARRSRRNRVRVGRSPWFSGGSNGRAGAGTGTHAGTGAGCSSTSRLACAGCRGYARQRPRTAITSALTPSDAFGPAVPAARPLPAAGPATTISPSAHLPSRPRMIRLPFPAMEAAGAPGRGPRQHRHPACRPHRWWRCRSTRADQWHRVRGKSGPALRPRPVRARWGKAAPWLAGSRGSARVSASGPPTA